MSYGVQDYEVICTIGTGSYGICNKIKRKKDGKILLWKQLDYGGMSEKEKTMLVSEVNLLRELKHKHIVRYYDRIIDRSTATLYIIMEYCEGGDLATYINKMRTDGKFVKETFVWKIGYQIVLALKECHSRHKNGGIILHRDLKPANVFLDSNMDVKLGDFGLARMLCSELSFAKTFVGTPYYMSPEQMNQMSYNEKSDVWSLGCLLFELCAFRPPFTASKQRELALKICSGRFPRLPAQYSDDLNEFISCMLQVDQAKRLTVEQLAAHPLLLKHIHISETSCTASEVSQKERDKEILLNELEVKLNQMEKILKEREKQLKEREKSCKLKEILLEAKEKDLLIREIQLNKTKRLLKNSFKTPSPNIPTNPLMCNSSDRENEEVSSSDTSSRSSSAVCARMSAKSREHLPKSDYSSIDRRHTSRNSSCSSSPTRKYISPVTDGLVYIPKLLTTRYKRSPLETLTDGNHQLIHQHAVNPYNYNKPATPQNIKHRLLKLL